MEEKQKAAGLDTERVIPTYFHLALPVVVGSIITIIYNLADTFFIARTNNALLVAGVSVCSPLFMILMAFGNIFGQGGITRRWPPARWSAGGCSSSGIPCSSSWVPARKCSLTRGNTEQC